MSLRGLSLLLLLLAAAVGLLIWLGREPRAPADTAREVPLVAAFQQDALREIYAACASDGWTLRREPRGWRIVKPFDAEADGRKVGDLIAGLQDARAGKTVAEAGADPAPFGLAPAQCRVALAVGEEPAPRLLRLGRTSPVGVERYALAADGRVVLTDGSIFGLVARGAESLRERRLLPVEAEAVTRIAIDRPDGRLVLAVDGGLWRILEPIGDSASTSACLNLARAITAIELTDARGVAKPIASRPDRRIAVEVTAGGDQRTRLAYVATAGVEGRRVGWRDGGALIGLLPDSAARELESGVDTFRDKRVTVLSAPDVRWVAVDRSGGSLRVERAGAGAVWTGRAGNAPFAPDAGRVEGLLARLRTLTAVGFEPAPAPAAGTATGTIAVGGATGELARITWGPLPPAPDGDGESIWVTTPARPGVVFRVLATELGPIPATVGDWTAVPSTAPAGAGS